MLTAEQRELITGAVDGELSATEARACLQLLEASAEARELHAQLTALSRRVRTLPQSQATPPADLRAKIMARVAASTPAPASPRKKQPALTPKTMPAPLAHPASPAPTPPARRAIPSWLPVVVAAGVLICVAAGSFTLFSKPGSATAKNPWAHTLPAPQDAPTAVPSPSQAAPRVQPHSDPHAVAHIDLSPVPVPVLPLPKEVVPEGIAIAPEPRPAHHDILGSRPLPPIPPFDLIQVRVPFLRAIAELERDDIRQDLRDELARDPAFRLDLFARDTARGVTLFQHAAKAAGLTVFSDAATLDKLKKRQARAVVIYVECLTAEELAVLFSKVSAEDKKVSPRVFDSLHATPTVRHDEKELRDVLGIDVGLYKRPAGSNGTGKGSQNNLLDKDGNPKPVSAGTIDTVTKSLTTPPAKPGEKPAVLMTWQTTHPTDPTIGRTPPNMSAELKQFLARRGDRKPNAVPAIIVIRPVG
jgi:hypothetical protein